MVKRIEKNSLREIKEPIMISKAELAGKANIYPPIITRIEEGMPCNIKTKRKIYLTLKLTDNDKVFHEVKELRQVAQELGPCKLIYTSLCDGTE